MLKAEISMAMATTLKARIKSDKTVKKLFIQNSIVFYLKAGYALPRY